MARYLNPSIGADISNIFFSYFETNIKCPLPEKYGLPVPGIFNGKANKIETEKNAQKQTKIYEVVRFKFLSGEADT